MAKGKATAPYGRFGSLKNFVAELKKTVYPDAIDRGMLKGMSGQTQTEVLSAMRFFGGLDKDGNTLDPLKKLVGSHGSSEWEKTLLAVITAAYKPIVGSINVKSGTGKQLQKTFRDATSSDGFMLRRQILFFLAALKDAGVEYSPHFKDATKGLTAKKKSSSTRKDRGNRPENGNGSEDNSATPDGTVRFPLYFKGKPEGTIIVPKKMDSDDIKVFDLTVTLIKAYAAQKD